MEVIAPPQMSITNLDSGETVFAQFNPATLKEKLGARYTKQNVQGGSHQPLQFDGTSNFSLTMTLIFDDDCERRSNIGTEESRKFMHSLVYPRIGQTSHIDQSPPQVHVFWPGVIGMIMKVIDIDGELELFYSDGSLRKWQCTVTFEEDVTLKIYSSRVRTYGTLRTEI